MRTPTHLALVCLFMVVAAQDARAGDRALHMRLDAQIAGRHGGDASIPMSDLVTDALPASGVTRHSNCIGRSVRARIVLAYRKQADDSVSVTGTVELVEGRNCGRNPSATRTINESLGRDREVAVPIDLTARSGTQLVGSLVLHNAMPSCTATHVRWRARMHIVDHDDWSSDERGTFDSAQVSALLEPDTSPLDITMFRVVDGETAAKLDANITSTLEHAASISSVLKLVESGSLFESSDDIDAIDSDASVLASGTERSIELHAVDEGRADATMTVENRGRPADCTAGYLVPYATVTIPPDLLVVGCGSTLRGCFSRRDGSAGWIRFGSVTCSGTGSARRCLVSGAGRGLVCPGGSWTFQDAVVDADCMGVRLVPSCLPNDAAIVRRTSSGATIRRESRADETDLVVGGACK